MVWPRAFHAVSAVVLSSVVLAAPAHAAVNAEAEVAAALFSASATQAAFEKAADGKLRAEHSRLVALQVQLRSQRGKAVTATAAQRAAEAQLATAQRDFVAQLAAKDRAFAGAIDIFRSQVTDIAASPAGAEALAMFNNGDEVGAISILKRLRAANDAARDKANAIASAAEGRRIAALEIEANQRGKVGTAEVIAQFEDVTAKDPGVMSDWISLSQFYSQAGLLDKALPAARRALALASNESERFDALFALGDVQKEAGDEVGVKTSAEEALSNIHRRVAQTPDDLDLQLDLSLALNHSGTMHVRAGEGAAALADYSESADVVRRLAAIEAIRPLVQVNLLVALQWLGDWQAKQGDIAGSRRSKQESVDIARALLAQDPENAGRRQNLASSLTLLADIFAREGDQAKAAVLDEESVTLYRALVASDPDNATDRRFLVYSLKNLGQARRSNGELAKALPSFEESVVLARRLTAADAGNAATLAALTTSLAQLIDARLEEKNFAAAIPLQEELAALFAKPPSGPGFADRFRTLRARLLRQLGETRIAAGRKGDAAKALDESLVLTQALLVQHPGDPALQRELSDIHAAMALIEKTHSGA